MMPVNLSDNIHKHKKEKEIDSFLFRKEAKRANELKAQVKEMEKVADIKLKQKRMRDREGGRENLENVNEKEEKAEIEEKKEINIRDAVEKILKHIEKPAAFGKCLNLLKSLFLNLENIQPLVIIKIFYKILKLPFKFSEMANKNLIQGKMLFKQILILDLYEYTKKEMDRIYKEDKIIFNEIFSLFSTAFDIELNLITDDSFKFNSVIKFLEKEFDAITSWENTEDTELNFFENNILKLNKLNNTEEDLSELDPYDEKYSNPENLKVDKKVLFTAIKRWLLFDSIKGGFKLSAFTWALPSINSLLKKAYLEKDKHNPGQLEEIENMVSTFKNKSSSSFNLNNTRAVRDGKIKDSPLEAYHKVTDAREEKIIESSVDTWQAKQAGIISGKLFMN